MHQNFSLLIDFTCAVAKDELKKHPEMRTIAMIELENNFPSDFSAKVLKCLPDYVAKVNWNLHTHVRNNNTIKLTKESLIIYIADEIEWEKSFYKLRFMLLRNFAVVSHLSKNLIVSSKRNASIPKNIKDLLNVAQIFEEDKKVIAESFDRTKNLTTFQAFESSHHGNLSQILFPDRTKNLNKKKKIYATFIAFSTDAYYPRDYYTKGINRPNCKWTPFMDILAEKLNATLKFTAIKRNDEIWTLNRAGRFDFHLNDLSQKYDLESYNNQDLCFLAPLPDPIQIYEQILFLPLDKSCWMWLGITIAVSTFVWRISEGHWGFPFGYFSYFIGQAQLIIRIRTDRLTMKILLQLLIAAIFIFSNGYQSLITSFMLNPVEEKLLKSLDEILDSNLKIEHFEMFELKNKFNPKFQKFLNDNRSIVLDRESDSWHDDVITYKVASLHPCKSSKFRIEYQGDGKSWMGQYLIPEVNLMVPADLFIRPMHPFLNIFQELMDRSLEAGLHQAWERFFWEIARESEKRKIYDENEKEILDFNAIAPFFLILVFGFVAALLALFCEIFHRDVVTELSKEYFKRKKKEFCGRIRTRQHTRINVRVIQVKPAPRRNHSI